MHSITIVIGVSVQTAVVPASRSFPDMLNACFSIFVRPELLTGWENCLSIVWLIKGKPQTLRCMVVALITCPVVRNGRGMGLGEGLGGQALDCVVSRAWGTAVSNLGGP